MPLISVRSTPSSTAFPTAAGDLHYRCVQGIVDGFRVQQGPKNITDVIDEEYHGPYVLSRLMKVQKIRKSSKRTRPQPANVFMAQQLDEGSRLVPNPTPTWVLERAPVALACAAHFENPEDMEQRLTGEIGRLADYRDRIRDQHTPTGSPGSPNRPRSKGPKTNRPRWY